MSRVQRWIVTTAAAVFLALVVLGGLALYLGHQADVKQQKAREAQIIQDQRNARASAEAAAQDRAIRQQRIQPAIDAINKCAQLANDMAEQKVTYDQYMAHCRTSSYQP